MSKEFKPHGTWKEWKARAEKAELKRDALQGAFDLMVVAVRDTTDNLIESRATIERIEALAERWRKDSSPKGPTIAGRIRADEIKDVLHD